MKIRNNQVQLIGHAPEIKELSNKKSLAKFSIAAYKDKNGNWVYKTDWHQVVAWGGSARTVRGLIEKGSEIAVLGKLATRQWEDENGITTQRLF